MAPRAQSLLVLGVHGASSILAAVRHSARSTKSWSKRVRNGLSNTRTQKRSSRRAVTKRKQSHVSSAIQQLWLLLLLQALDRR